MKKRLGILLILLPIASAVLLYQPARSAAPEIFRWLSGLGNTAIAVVLFLYFSAAILGLPVAWITVGAGALFGPWTALLLATVGANAAANVAFRFGRTVGRERFESWIIQYPKIKAFVGAVSRDGFRIVFLARLSPGTPYGLLNYTLSVSSISQGSFALATLLGKTPWNIFYCFLGAGARDAAEAAAGNVQKGEIYYWLLGVGIVATGLFMFAVARVAKRALKAAAGGEIAADDH